MLWVAIIILLIYVLCLKIVISHQEDVIDWQRQHIEKLEGEHHVE